MSSNLPRVVTRIDEETRDLLMQAATLSGMTSLNAFMVSAAMEKAQAIIERNRVIRMSESDAMALVEILENPPKANDKLVNAFKSYKEMVQQ